MDIGVVVSRPGVVHVAVVGELDMFSAPELSAVLAAPPVSGARTVTLDLGAVSFCAAAGLSVLLDARRPTDPGVHLLIGARSPAVLRAIRAAGLDDRLGPSPSTVSSEGPDDRSEP